MLTGVRAHRKEATALYHLWVVSRWKVFTLTISGTRTCQSFSQQATEGASWRRLLRSARDDQSTPVSGTRGREAGTWAGVATCAPPFTSSADTELDGITHRAQQPPLCELEAAMPEAGTSLPRPPEPSLAGATACIALTCALAAVLGPPYCPRFAWGPREPQPGLRALPGGERMDLCSEHACSLHSAFGGRFVSPGVLRLPLLWGPASRHSGLVLLHGALGFGLVLCIRFLHFPVSAATQHFNFTVK